MPDFSHFFGIEVKIVEVRPLEGYKLWLRFDDGSEGVVTFDEAEFTGVMAPLKNPAFFAQAYVEPGFGALACPGEIELDPLRFAAISQNAGLAFKGGPK